MSYQDELIRHLIEYKRKNLSGTPTGTYRYGGKDVPHDHILQPKDMWVNLIEEKRSEIKFYLSKNPQIKTHKYFHHLNSSQAFTFNLFVPFFEGGVDASTALLRALGQSTALVSWKPEAIPEKREGTNIDVLWNTSDGVQTFCEVKLSERDFGKARSDERHLEKLRDIYLPRLKPYLDQESQLAPAFKSYQILRNVWHMIKEPNSKLIFVMPRANTLLWPVLDNTLSHIPSVVRCRISAVSIEDVIDRLSESRYCPSILRSLRR